MSSERSQFAVVAAKGKREMMDFEFLGDDDDAEEDKVPDYIANMEEWMRNKPAGFGVDKVSHCSPAIAGILLCSARSTVCQLLGCEVLSLQCEYVSGFSVLRTVWQFENC